MSEQREPGFYWIRQGQHPDYRWEPAHWFDDAWYVVGEREPDVYVRQWEIGPRLPMPGDR